MDDEKETGRLEAFSDGVFAVAITLLVLDIKIPATASPEKLLDDPHLLSAFFAQWPVIAAFVTSFATIGIMWINHHRLFTHIKRSNTVLQLLNLLLLLIIVFIPVPTALLAEYFTRPDQHTAAIIFCGSGLLMAVFFNLLWRYAAHNGRLLGKNVNMREVEGISKQYLFGPGLYLVVLALAFFNTPAAIAGSFILAIFFAFSGRSIKETIHKESKTVNSHLVKPEIMQTAPELREQAE